jgi:hypothetical protein
MTLMITATGQLMKHIQELVTAVIQLVTAAAILMEPTAKVHVLQV